MHQVSESVVLLVLSKIIMSTTKKISRVTLTFLTSTLYTKILDVNFWTNQSTKSVLVNKQLLQEETYYREEI